MKAFYTRRMDRLGARLCPLINGYNLSNQYDTDYIFLWPETFDIEPAEQIFRSDFIRAHQSKTQKSLSEPHLKIELFDITNTVVRYNFTDKNADYQSVNHPFGIYCLDDEAPEAMRRSAAELFETKILRQDLLQAVQSMKNLIGGDFRALHIRRGDLKEYVLRDGNEREIFLRYVPESSSIIPSQKTSDKKTVIFTDAEEEITDSANAIFASDLFRKAGLTSLSPMQRAILDMVMLGAGNQIISGKSAFSACSSLLSGLPITHPILFMGPKAYSEMLLSRGNDFLSDIPLPRLHKTLHYAMGQLCRAGKQKDALIVADILYADKDDTAEFYEALGHANMYCHNFEEAERSFAMSLVRHDTPSALVGLARAAKRLGKAVTLDAMVKKMQQQYAGNAAVVNFIKTL